MHDLTAIAGGFALVGLPISIEVHTGGHINDTWFVTTDRKLRYVLQRINAQVFADPPGIVGNTARVIAEIERRAAGLVPPFVVARDGATAVIEDGSTYRMLGFVAGRSLTGLQTAAQAAAAGLAFGSFQRALLHYDRARHVVPIPHFHELGWRALHRDDPDQRVDAVVPRGLRQHHG